MARLALILSFLLLFTAPAAFAFDGLSIGVGIGVATDIGDYKSLDTTSAFKFNPDAHFDEDSVAVTPNANIYMRYDFIGFFFIRGGIEYYELAGGSELRGHYIDGPDEFEVRFKYDYRAFTVPVVFGLNIPVRRGRYNIFAGAGPAFVKVTLEKDYQYINGGTLYRGHIKGDTSGPGTALIAGMSVNLSRNLHFVIEYQKLHFSQYTAIKGYEEREFPPGTFQSRLDSEETINLSAPDNTIRFGLVYDI